MFVESQASPSAVCRARWITEARNGSRPALNQLFQACFPYLLAVAHREFSAALRSRLDPGDVVQDTLMKAWRRFPQFRGQSEADLLAWLRQILRRNLANERRRHLRTAMRSTRLEVELAEAALMQLPDTADSDAELPGRRALVRERQEALEDALRQLPDHYRQALCLRAQEELTFAQVGERLRCSAEAARKLCRRAAEEFTRTLGDGWKL